MTDHIIRYKKTPFRVIPKSKPAGFLISGLFWIIMEQCAFGKKIAVGIAVMAENISKIPQILKLNGWLNKH